MCQGRDPPTTEHRDAERPEQRSSEGDRRDRRPVGFASNAKRPLHLQIDSAPTPFARGSSSNSLEPYRSNAGRIVTACSVVENRIR